jgi:putative N-acetylmannosamine-6-phosphate 2-epimerase 1
LKETNLKKNIESIHKKLIVSCQALDNEPLHSPFIMGRMALAALEGGACGIRANTKEDISEIQKCVNLPIIGIVKRDYEDSNIYITPTMKEIDELMEVKPDIIALDATCDIRPNGLSLQAFYNEIREKYPEQLLMGDCSTIEEMLNADAMGFDFIGTTLVGYTNQSKGLKIENNDFEIIRKVLKLAKHPLIAEGNIDTPEKAKRVIELGAYSVVVGSIITRPQIITRSFVNALELDN